MINPNGGNSATNTLTIKPASGVSPVFSGSSTTGLIVLNGIDYVTIDGSNSGGSSRDTTFTNNGTTTTSAVIWGQTIGTADPTTNNTIKNLNVSGNASTTTFAGIGFGSSTIGTGTLGTRNDNNRVQNNNITQLQFGVVSVGAQSAAKNTGTVVTGNTLGGNGAAALGRAGVWVAFDDGAQVTNNTVVNVFASNSADVFGIALGTNRDRRRRARRSRTSRTSRSRGNFIGTVAQDGHVLGGRHRARHAELRHEPDREQLGLRRRMPTARRATSPPASSSARRARPTRRRRSTSTRSR